MKAHRHIACCNMACSHHRHRGLLEFAFLLFWSFHAVQTTLAETQACQLLANPCTNQTSCNDTSGSVVCTCTAGYIAAGHKPDCSNQSTEPYINPIMIVILGALGCGTLITIGMFKLAFIKKSHSTRQYNVSRPTFQRNDTNCSQDTILALHRPTFTRTISAENSYDNVFYASKEFQPTSECSVGSTVPQDHWSRHGVSDPLNHSVVTLDSSQYNSLFTLCQEPMSETQEYTSFKLPSQSSRSMEFSVSGGSFHSRYLSGMQVNSANFREVEMGNVNDPTYSDFCLHQRCSGEAAKTFKILRDSSLDVDIYSDFVPPTDNPKCSAMDRRHHARPSIDSLAECDV